MRKVILGTVLGLLAAGPALAAERGYTVAGFDRVRSAGPFDVEIRVGGPVSVRAFGPQRAIDRLEVRAEGGALTIGVQDGSWDWRSLIAPNEKLVVRVTVPSLAGVTLAGSGDVTVDRARGTAFAASLSGSGDLSIGTIEAQGITLKLAGSGDLTAAGRARCTINRRGSGDVRCGG